MKNAQKPMKTIINTAVVAIICGASAHAGGFSLYTEGNGFAVGNFGAGIAAEARDASTTWYNPAGLALIRDEQVVMGGIGVFPKAQLSGTTQFHTGPVNGPVDPFKNRDAAVNALVPSSYFAMPLGENVTFGIGLLAPFGLSTDWGRNSPLRYAATFTELLTFNFAPSIGGKVTENIAVGAGIDVQYARVKFNTVLGSPLLSSQFMGEDHANEFDSLSYNKGQSVGIGFHAGILAMFRDNHTRIGLNYQSRMKHKFNGYSELSGPLALAAEFPPEAPLPKGTSRNQFLNSNRVELPEIATLSLYQDVSEKIALLGSVVYTGWHTLKDIQLNNVVVGAPLPPTVGDIPTGFPPAPFAAISKSSENYKNAWRFAVGANVQVNEKAMLTFGGGFDGTPTRNAFRTVRLPDADRWALSIGGHYQAKEQVGIDFGYTYLWAKNSPTINKTVPAGAGSNFTVNARGDANAHLVGLQVVWKTDMVSKAINRLHG